MEKSGFQKLLSENNLCWVEFKNRINFLLKQLGILFYWMGGEWMNWNEKC